jgi:hypothetical protein
LLVPLCGVAFVPATVKLNTSGTSGSDEGDGSGDSPSVYFRQDGEGSDGLEILYSTKQEEGSMKRYTATTIDKAITRLEEEKHAMEREVSILRDEVVSLARATLMERMGGVSSGDADQAQTPVDEQGQALNEEGLPFVDLVEPVAEGREGNDLVPITPLEREPMTKEARRHWMDTVLSRLEEDEITEQELNGRGGVGGEPSTPEQPSRVERATLHRRLSSAERPAPTKSVLKQTGPVAPPLPKFGSSGIRRGFLNLNPSSPAAVHSSDPINDWKPPQETAMSQSISSLQDEAGHGEGSASDSLDERMSRSADSLAREKAPQRNKKKTVRIQSPSRERKPSEAISVASSSSKAKSIRNSDDDMEDEAKSILELLGLDAIKGHPQAAGLYEALKDSEKMKELASKAEAARLTALEKEAQKPKKAAVSQKVTERTPTAKDYTKEMAANETGTRMGGFKKGFLNPRPSSTTAPTVSSSDLPSAPRISQGLSALERAAQSDQSVEEERVKNGLKPTVPHARPSKAFAEKLEAKKRGERNQKTGLSEEEGRVPERIGRVRFDDQHEEEEVKRSHSAHTPSSTRNSVETKLMEGSDAEDDDEDDGTLDSIGMSISEEYLDEDTVEALGYFSDEEFDPDIGFDEDDIIQSRPHFKGNGSEIANEDLRREYERVKATLGARSQNNNDLDDAEEDEDDYREGKDLSLPGNEEQGTARVSRFKQDRLKRALSGQNVVSNELGTGLEGAKNVGPRMLIPSIANVRFPTQGQDVVEGQELQLDGQDDEEDDQLEEIMRMRLSQSQQQDGVDYQTVKARRQPIAPPTIRAAEQNARILSKKRGQQSSIPRSTATATSPSPPPPPKKPSLFKTRMSQQ